MKYRVSGTVTISVFVDVEASSEEDAKDKADAADMMHLCYACSRADDGIWSTSGELDGIPEILSVEVLDTPKRKR